MHGNFSANEVALVQRQAGNVGARALWMARWDSNDVLPGKKDPATLKKCDCHDSLMLSR